MHKSSEVFNVVRLETPLFITLVKILAQNRRNFELDGKNAEFASKAELDEKNWFELGSKKSPKNTGYFLQKTSRPPVEFSTDLKFRQTALSYNQNCIT